MAKKKPEVDAEKVELTEEQKFSNLLFSTGAMIDALGELCVANLAGGTDRMVQIVSPLRGDGAGQIVDGQRSALRAYAGIQAIGQLLMNERDTLAGLIQQGVESKTLESVFGAAFDAWQKHGDRIGMPFPRGPQGDVGADFDNDIHCSDPDCVFCRAPVAKAAPDGSPHPDSLKVIFDLWQGQGGTKDAFFDAVDALKKPAAEADKVAP